MNGPAYAGHVYVGDAAPDFTLTPVPWPKRNAIEPRRRDPIV
jgi:hypothetical protein